MTLAESQRLFFRLVTARGGVAAALAASPEDARAVEEAFAGTADLGAPERLEIYARMYVARLVDALRGDLPRVVAAVGDGAFYRLAVDYLSAHPPSRPSLRDAGEHLAAFVRGHALSAERPYLGDLAALEWARVCAFDAPDAVPLPIGRLRPLAPDAWGALRLSPAPSLRVIDLAYPAHETWKLLDAGEHAPAPDPHATTVRVWREGFAVWHAAVEPDEARALRSLLACEDFATLCERAEAPVERIFEIMLRWVGDGIVREA